MFCNQLVFIDATVYVCMYVCTVYAYQDQFGSCHDEAASPFNITLYISTVALDRLYDSDQE